MDNQQSPQQGAQDTKTLTCVEKLKQRQQADLLLAAKSMARQNGLALSDKERAAAQAAGLPLDEENETRGQWLARLLRLYEEYQQDPQRKNSKETVALAQFLFEEYGRAKEALATARNQEKPDEALVQQLQANLDQLEKVADPMEYKARRFACVIAQKPFKKAAEELKQYGRREKVTPERIQRRRKLADALAQEGITPQDAVPLFVAAGRNEKRSVKDEIMSWVWTILAALAIALLLRALVAEPIRVEGESMTNTLANNEIVLVSKLDYRFGKMQRGDVVICRYPNRTNYSVPIGAAVSFINYTLFVKRLVALPGDTVEIKTDGHLYVNGELVPDPEHMNLPPRTTFGPLVLGDDEYFVIGDNRGNSNDSRNTRDVGPLSADQIMGKVKCVLWPLNRIRGVE